MRKVKFLDPTLIRRNGSIYAIINDGVANTLYKQNKIIFLDLEEIKKEEDVIEENTIKGDYPDNDDPLFSKKELFEG